MRTSRCSLDASAYQQGVPELVAAELVRDVVEPKEFHEFCQYDCLTVRNGDKYYRIPRRPHGLIEVWDAQTRRPVARLCVVFQDPGMPPSDEVVMKYLLAKHQPDTALAGRRPLQPARRPVRGHAAEALERRLLDRQPLGDDPGRCYEAFSGLLGLSSERVKGSHFGFQIPESEIGGVPRPLNGPLLPGRGWSRKFVAEVSRP